MTRPRTCCFGAALSQPRKNFFVHHSAWILGLRARSCTRQRKRLPTPATTAVSTSSSGRQDTKLVLWTLLRTDLTNTRASSRVKLCDIFLLLNVLVQIDVVAVSELVSPALLYSLFLCCFPPAHNTIEVISSSTQVLPQLNGTAVTTHRRLRRVESAV